MIRIHYLIFSSLLLLLLSCGDNGVNPSSDTLQLVSARAGQVSLQVGETAIVMFDSDINLIFSGEVDASSIEGITIAQLPSGQQIEFNTSTSANIVLIELGNKLIEGNTYQLRLPNEIIGVDGSTFAGLDFVFEIATEALTVSSLSVEGVELRSNNSNLNIPINSSFTLLLSHDVDPQILKENIFIVGAENYTINVEESGDATYLITTSEPLEEFSKINLLLSSSIGTEIGRAFSSVSYELYTDLDGIPDFPVITDEELLTKVQKNTFKYFWDFAHPVSGMARERNTSGNTVTSGGSGFGLMAIIIGVERGFITREEAVERWEKIMLYLDSADRFHGVWSHWINGNSGNVIPFSQRDDGGDLVETAFLVQGMLTVRQYLNQSDPREKTIADLITKMWEEVEWDWYTKGGGDVLFWHWSPQYDWQMNLPIRGHNETQIVYTLAAASPTHSIDKSVYEDGYARSGGMTNGNSLYGIVLPLGNNGPLFFTHYSYLGMDPRNLKDKYANYWQQNQAHSLINRAYCIDNPRGYVGYSEECWGLTASDGDSGYSAHSPNNDRGVITPTAAISSIPFTPDESMAAIRHFYYDLGSRLWGEYGFYDAFNPTAGWVANSYLAIDQGPIICMIENHRTGLLWDLYMSAPEVRTGLDKLEFTY